jgi:hypothetical protein
MLPHHLLAGPKVPTTISGIFRYVPTVLAHILCIGAERKGSRRQWTDVFSKEKTTIPRRSASMASGI